MILWNRSFPLISNTDWSWSALFADFNNDSWQDLFVSNGYKRDYTNRDFLSYMENFIGEKKSNLKREDVLEIINNMPASNVSNYIFSNQKGMRFEDVTEEFRMNHINKEEQNQNKLRREFPLKSLLLRDGERSDHQRHRDRRRRPFRVIRMGGGG